MSFNYVEFYRRWHESDKQYRAQPITESLGNNRAVELDETTGTITILDEQHGVTLSAAQVLVLTGFLSQHDATLIRAALALIDEHR